jgi:eukaryotic-like serine/threonine-protein kinase
MNASSVSGSVSALGPGSHLGPYTLLCAVAQGGMARVWAARGPNGELVAIKTIRAELADDPVYRELFVDEARFAASVTHPNVCRVYGLGEQDGVLYIVMEWVSGESLARIVRPNKQAQAEPIEPRMAARCLADTCAALDAAHELQTPDGRRLRIVHSDVSPQNLLATRGGEIKLVDFGVARALGLRGGKPAPRINGKAAYMAPEQAAGRALSHLSDVFVLGVCLYELTTTVRPFATGDWEATIERLLQGDFRSPQEIVPDYPEGLERIVLRAMAARPAHRYPNAKRMRDALEDWLRRSGPPIGRAELAAFVEMRAGRLIREREEYIASVLGGR